MENTGVIDEIQRLHPQSGPRDQVVMDALRAAAECVEVTTSCADACLAEDSAASMRGCIRSCLDAADVNTALVRVLPRATEPANATLRTLLTAAAQACRDCAERCRLHADAHDHCRVCAEVCEQTAEACERAADTVPPVS